MLFFFELILFALILATLALGEFVARGWALTLWLSATVLALGGYLLARATLQPLLTGQVTFVPAQPPRQLGEPSSVQSDLPAVGDQQLSVADDELSHAGETKRPEMTPGEPAQTPRDDRPAPLDEKWARTLLYNWRRANALLVLGALATVGWYWLGG